MAFLVRSPSQRYGCFKLYNVLKVLQSARKLRDRDFLNDMFDQIDEDDNGFIDENELHEAVNKYLEVDMELDEVNVLLRQIDKDQNGRIEREEFIDFCNRISTREQLQRLVKTQRDLIKSQNFINHLFSQFDADDSGTIDGQELQYAVQSLGLSLSAVEIRRLLKRIDRDGNGAIEVEEFRQFAKQAKDAEELKSVIKGWQRQELYKLRARRCYFCVCFALLIASGAFMSKTGTRGQGPQTLLWKMAFGASLVFTLIFMVTGQLIPTYVVRNACLLLEITLLRWNRFRSGIAIGVCAIICLAMGISLTAKDNRDLYPALGVFCVALLVFCVMYFFKAEWSMKAPYDFNDNPYEYVVAPGDLELGAKKETLQLGQGKFRAKPRDSEDISAAALTDRALPISPRIAQSSASGQGSDASPASSGRRKLHRGASDESLASARSALSARSGASLSSGTSKGSKGSKMSRLSKLSASAKKSILEASRTIVQEPPPPPLGITVTNVTAGACRVQWKAIGEKDKGEPNGPIIHVSPAQKKGSALPQVYEITHFIVSLATVGYRAIDEADETAASTAYGEDDSEEPFFVDVLTINVTAHGNKHYADLKSLRPGRRYLVQMASKNYFGRGPPSRPVSFCTPIQHNDPSCFLFSPQPAVISSPPLSRTGHKATIQEAAILSPNATSRQLGSSYAGFRRNRDSPTHTALRATLDPLRATDRSMFEALRAASSGREYSLPPTLPPHPHALFDTETDADEAEARPISAGRQTLRAKMREEALRGKQAFVSPRPAPSLTPSEWDTLRRQAK
ncbi:unnamed protein product [Vitrella brassicaformis CCMP3155]|uniref:EF-hand domain-containing protein n=1 Tax=Vitrella brassicaformis (strain CCMP3155) TaxID=1169540 RepID=A0A0G4ERJ1_VITBC|nr:unnamed protein product [Vitrella brassicaformis CCMP3155]|eukprot:CEM00649.1 unnamed protein product [Vitrella brassicaformis CCMP3155]